MTPEPPPEVKAAYKAKLREEREATLRDRREHERATPEHTARAILGGRVIASDEMRAVAHAYLTLLKRTPKRDEIVQQLLDLLASDVLSSTALAAEVRALATKQKKKDGCEHQWSDWTEVGRHVERKCQKCGKEQYDD